MSLPIAAGSTCFSSLRGSYPMAEEDKKKPKIDLKARLGKKTISSGAGASIPPPVGMQPGTSIPAPPFGARPAPAIAPAPQLDPSNPYAAVAAVEAPRPAPAQAIRIEMSEEIVEAQKRGRGKIIALAVATALVGGVIGYAFGGGAERGRRHETALQGAAMLVEEVDKANAEIEKLAEVLKKAKTKLSEGKYPEEEVNELGGIDIPFDGNNLAGKGTGLMGNEVNRLLVKYAGDAAAANEQKDTLKRVLSGRRKLVEELLAQKETPKVNWAVFVADGPHGPMAAMQRLPTPFLVKSDKGEGGKPYSWPDEFELKDGDKTVKVKRYTRGQPGSELIPVDPSTESAVCPSDTLMQIAREISNLETTLKGDKSDPTNEKTGLIDTGTALLERLKAIGVSG